MSCMQRSSPWTNPYSCLPDRQDTCDFLRRQNLGGLRATMEDVLGFLRQPKVPNPTSEATPARRAPEAGRAEELLRDLLPAGQVADRFDASYLDDLPEILRELHGINTPDGGTASDHRVAELQRICKLDAGAPGLSWRPHCASWASGTATSRRATLPTSSRSATTTRGSRRGGGAKG